MQANLYIFFGIGFAP